MTGDETDRLLTMGEDLFERGDLEGSRRCFERVLELFPRQTAALNNLGVIAMQRQEPQSAINYFTSALESDPFYRDALLNFADLLRTLGLSHEMVPYLEKAAQRDPGDEELISTLGVAKGAPARGVAWKMCYSPGVAMHGERFRCMLALDHYIPALHLREPVWFFGLYFDSDYHQVLAHQGRKIINWRGSDTLQLRDHPWRIGVLRQAVAVHVCQSERQQEVLTELGVPSIIRPMFNSPVQEVKPTPFPAGRTAVLVPWRRGIDGFIQADLFFQVASRCPDVLFHVVGDEDPSRFQGPGMGNIIFHSHIPEPELDHLMNRCKGIIRPWLSDGTPNIQTRMLLKGRYAAHTCRFEKVARCSTADDYVRWVEELKGKREPNTDAREWWIKNLNNFDFLEGDFDPGLDFVKGGHEAP